MKKNTEESLKARKTGVSFRQDLLQQLNDYAHQSFNDNPSSACACMPWWG